MFRWVFLLLAAAITSLTLAASPALHDPMRPYSKAAAKRAPSISWRLTSIVRNGDRHVAMINGRAVQVGDTVGGARVEAIEPWEVHLRQGDKNIVIPLRRSKLRDDTNEREAKP